MTTTTQQSINKKAIASYQLLNASLDWVRNSKEPEISGNARLIKNLRTGIFQLHRLSTSAQAKMCVGVYGPSQAGKSYLVSALARKPGERLIAVVGNKHVDFIEAINPEGGKESTGLVTRFTTDELATPENFPIQLKLLSELDLTKLFVNSYVNDIFQDEDDEIEKHQLQVEQVLNELEMLPGKPSKITVEDVYDLEDYCNSKFSSKNFRIQALKKMGFWTRAATLLPNLDNVGRLRLFNLLWEDIPSYSNLYSSLVAELTNLENAPFVYSAIEALLSSENGTLCRSKNSIINVSTLDELSKEISSSIDVSTSVGKVYSISLPKLCALTSELVIQIKNKPHDFFKSADLLDFPGARSRKGHPKGDKSLNQPHVQIDNFLRGKVAYLFDKYSADLELTSMLLCIGPSNQEVVGLDAMVEDWIIKSHGGKPEARAKLTNSLFLVLSKFDQEFDEGSGKTLDGTRWSTRLQASLINSFGAHAHRTNWVHKWTNESPFKNTFWLRNPNADQSGLIDYEGTPGSSKELDYSLKKKPVIETLKQSFLSNPIVQNHFDDPNLAWDAGMSLNDGGASFLLKKLAATCSSDLKLRQIDERLLRIVENLESDLRKYYVSSDLEKLQLEKIKIARGMAESFAKLLSSQRLGEFVSSLLESDIDSVDTYKRLLLDFEREKHSKKGNNNSAQQSNFKIDPRDAEELGLDLQLPLNTNEVDLNKPNRSFSQAFIYRFIEEWRNKCLNKLSAENLSEYLLIERDLVLQFLNEVEIAANRTGLIADLISYVERNQQYKSDDRRSWIWRQTSFVTAKFNDFIACGGLQIKPNQAETITNLAGKEIRIFQDKIEPINSPEITEIQEDFSRRYLLDWIQAVQFSIRKNAVFQAGIHSDVESNLSLGKILAELDQILDTGKNIHAT